jgi:hypothetical protein
MTITRLRARRPWHAFCVAVVVKVQCPRCGASYETTLPAAGVRRVARCAACNRTGLEVIEEAPEAKPCTADDGAAHE